MEVAADWVRENISEDARAIIHRVSDDVDSEHADASGQVETGFVTIVDNGEQPDDDQVSKIRYLPPKKKVTANGRAVVFPAKWRGVIKAHTLGDKRDRFVTLTQEWMDENIEEDLQNFIKSLRDHGTGAYVRIPEGAPADHGDLLGETSLLDPSNEFQQMSMNAPKMQYRQVLSRNCLDRSCVLKAAASCLFYLGYKRISFTLTNDLHKGHKMEVGFEFFQTMLQPDHLTANEKRELQFMKLKPRYIHSWQILEDSKKYIMSLIGLLSDDGKTDHAVAVAGDWIFDSNFPCALPLTQDSLDKCCSDVSRRSKCLQTTHVYMLRKP